MWRWLMLLVACGGVKTPAKTRELGADRLIAASQRGDAVTIEAMLGDKLAFGGLWFPDENCRRTFPDAGSVVPAARSKLAKCIATLPLTKSKREHVFPEVAVLAYEPGLEIEVQFDRREPRILWIGYVSRTTQGDNLPTITQAALESHVTSGSDFDEPTRTKLATILAAAPPVFEKKPTVLGAWIKLCIDANGVVTTVRPRMTNSVEALDVMIEAAKQRTFRPFLLGGQPVPVCSLIGPTYPSNETKDDKPPKLPPPVPDEHMNALLLAPGVRKRVSGSIMLTPDDRTRSRLRGRTTIDGWFLYCVDEAGAVDHSMVLRSTGFGSYDERVARAIRDWKFAPQLRRGRPVRTCSHFVLMYRQS